MKRTVIAILVLSFALTAYAYAAVSEHELKPVPGGVTIDGVLSPGEWDGAVMISLDKENTGMWANFYDENSRLPLYAYFFYGEEGIFVGADIYDNDVDTEKMHDCFEVAFNPGGLIPDGDRLEGLFFTFWLKGDAIVMKRHNRFDGDQSGSFEDGAVCKYSATDHGYTVEALIKWEWLTLADRPVLNKDTGGYETGVLDKFDYRADGAFTYAIVCYLNGNGGDSAPYRCVYRTVTDPESAGNFSTATYDVRFTFGKEAETQTDAAADTETGAQTEPDSAPLSPTSDTTSVADAGRGNAKPLFIIIGVCAVVIAVAAAAVIYKKAKKKKS